MNYRDRTLDSFANEIICTPARKRINQHNGSVWFYSSFDVGPVRWPSDPDFGVYGCGKTPEEAVESMAYGIRKYLDTPRYRDVFQRCKKWWVMKELGLDKLPEVQEMFNTFDYYKVYSWFYDFELPEKE